MSGARLPPPEEPGATGSRCDLRVCFFGDSFTAGVGDPSGVGWVGLVAAAARAQGHDLTVYNMGVRRDTSLDVAQRWLPEARVRLKDGQAFGVVFALGTNDVDMQLGQVRVPPGRSLALLAAMLDDAHAARWHTLVVGPPPVLDRQASKRAADLAAAMAQVCTTRSVPFVDVTALSADPVWSQEIAAGDAYHPFAAGYARLAALVEPVLLRWLAGMPADLRYSTRSKPPSPPTPTDGRCGPAPSAQADNTTRPPCAATSYQRSSEPSRAWAATAPQPDETNPDTHHN